MLNFIYTILTPVVASQAETRGFSFYDILYFLLTSGVIIGCVYVGKQLQTLKAIDKAIIKIKHNIKVIADCLIRTESINFDHEKLASYSPLKLTNQGQAFLKDIGFIELFNKNSQDFFDWMQSEQPKTKYDVEISAIKSFIVLSSKEYFKDFKKYLFNNPKENLYSIAKIAGVYIRDKYLEQHLEIQS